MENLSNFSIANKEQQEISEDYKMNYYDNLLLSQGDALKLQELFMTLGVQFITCKNIDSGRKLINCILSSLRYHKNIGAVAEKEGLPSFAYNILEQAKLENNYSNNLIIDLENFLIVNPSFDFIWIELSKNLRTQYTYEKIKTIFDMYHVNERMTVLILVYELE